MLILVAAGQQLHAQVGEKSLTVERISAPLNAQAPLLEVSLDHPSLVYELDEIATITVKTEVNGFLYVIYVHTDGEPTLLFPNQHELANAVTKGGSYQIPADNASFQLRVTAPTGQGFVKAFVLDQPSTALQMNPVDAANLLLDLDLQRLNALQSELSKGVGVRPGNNAAADNPGKPQVLADHLVRLTTVSAGRFGKGEDRSVRGKQRFVVAFGVGVQEAGSGFRSITACTNDAREFVQLMKRQYGAEVTLLLDQEVTAESVQKTLSDVAHKTQPKDEVIVFWSGHGDQVVDVSGDEADGLDELLVPWNGNKSDVATTMILDDMLGRWIQEFSGCEVLVILDACHSGGHARNEKGISWEGDFNRFTKDITEDQAAVICSSSRSELSFPRKEMDLSVMTHFLIEILAAQDQRTVTVPDIMRYLGEKVPEYMKKRIGLEQTPVLVGNNKPRIVFEK
jgi:hypothetical protein